MLDTCILVVLYSLGIDCRNLLVKSLVTRSRVTYFYFYSMGLREKLLGQIIERIWNKIKVNRLGR